MKYTAIYREKGNAYYEDMTRSDYTSKALFAKELRRNGYMVAGIFTDEQIKRIQDSDPSIIFKFNEKVVDYVRDWLD